MISLSGSWATGMCRPESDRINGDIRVDEGIRIIIKLILMGRMKISYVEQITHIQQTSSESNSILDLFSQLP